MISRAKKYVAVLLAFVCVCMIFSPQTAYAAEDSSQHETVKVGFFAMDGYHVMDEEGNRSGYGYDFLRLMARYWDVDYEYVGYDKSWDDMQQMLEDGEIDMVTSARKTPDREEKFDFSRPIGTNYGMLTVRSDNSTIVDGNYSTYNGMRVALLNGNTRNEEFADFADNKGFTYVPSYFDTTTEMDEALQSEKVDAIVTSSLRKTNNERIVDKFGSSDFYVIVKKGNTKLSVEFNGKAHKLIAVPDDFFTNLESAMPGDILKDAVQIANTTDQEAELFFQTNTDGRSEEQMNMLKKVRFEISQNKKILYKGTLDAAELAKARSLGKFKSGQKGRLEFQLEIPREWDNAYALKKTDITWIFAVKENEKKEFSSYESVGSESAGGAAQEKDIKTRRKNPVRTGDDSEPLVLLILLLGSGAITLCIRCFKGGNES